MKIAIFSDSYFPRINGVSVSVHSYAVELTKLGHEVYLICLEYPEEQQKTSFFDEKSEDAKAPFKITRLPSTKMLFSPEDRMIRADKWRKIKKIMDNFHPDVIHINTEGTIAFLGSFYARHRKVPYVHTFHTLWEEYLVNYVPILPVHSLKKIVKSGLRFYMKRADIVISPTQRIASIVESYMDSKPIDIVPTGIPDEKMQVDQEKVRETALSLESKYPQIKGKKILLFVGRVEKEKNIEILFGVLEKVKKQVPDVVLMIVGDGHNLYDLKELCFERQLENDVVFTGYIPSKDVANFYYLADVFVFPSKTETQGLVTLEAMFAGLPVVAIGEMGTLDVMQGDNGGFMVKDDVDEFAAKTVALLTDEKLHKEKSHDAVEWSQQWKMSTLTKKLVEIYEKAKVLRNDRK